MDALTRDDRYWAKIGGEDIYVPTGSLNAYQTAAKWSTWASQMVEE